MEIYFYNVHELYIPLCAQSASNAVTNALHYTIALRLYKCTIWLAR
jgi:hypothetical protein